MLDRRDSTWGAYPGERLTRDDLFGRTDLAYRPKPIRRRPFSGETPRTAEEVRAHMISPAGQQAFNAFADVLMRVAARVAAEDAAAAPAPCPPSPHKSKAAGTETPGGFLEVSR